MKLLLLSTCGTSLFTNGATTERRGWVNQVANRPTLDEGAEAQLAELVRGCRAGLLGASEAEQRRLSAELNGVGAVLARWQPDLVHHSLVPSDTAIGRAAADLVTEALEARKQPVNQLHVGGLRTDDGPSFREAVAELTKRFEDEMPRWKQQDYGVVFNLAGGFKSVNAYLQALGMLYADYSVFLFESSPELIEIPKIPLRLADFDEVRRYLGVFRRLSVGYVVSSAEASGISEALLLSLDGRVTLSVWGDVVWARARHVVLSEGLLEPLSPKVRLQPAVKREFGRLEGARKVQVNERLDELSAYHDHDRPLLQAAKLKGLKGNPRPPSTHELYAWSDGDARRFYGHYEDNLFVVDDLGQHL